MVFEICELSRFTFRYSCDLDQRSKVTNNGIGAERSILVITIPTLIEVGTIVCEKNPTLSFFFKFECASIISPWIQISRTKLVCVTYTRCPLYPYQVSSSWHAWFLRYWNCLFFIHADPVTWIKVKGHQQWYRCKALNGGYNHTNFDWGRYRSLEDMSNVKFLDTAGRPAGQTDEHWRLHRLTFFQCESKIHHTANTSSMPWLWYIQAGTSLIPKVLVVTLLDTHIL